MASYYNFTYKWATQSNADFGAAIDAAFDTSTGHTHSGTDSAPIVFASSLKTAHIADAATAAGGVAAKATLTTGVVGNNNSIDWTARDYGDWGNGITIACTNPATDGGALSVAVNANDIVVTLATSAQVKATLSTALTGANNDMVFTAVAYGAGGNSIRIRYVDPGAAGASISCTVSTNDITVNLATSAVAASSLSTDLAGDNGDLVFTAATAGVAGDLISVEYVNPAADSPLIIDVEGNAIIVHLAYALGAITTIASDITTAIGADAEANALVSVANKAGNNGSGLVTAMAHTHLSGGSAGGVITSTAANVKTIVDATPAAAALVTCANKGADNGTGVVTAMAYTALTGGVTTGIAISTATEVMAAVAASGGANGLVASANTSGSSGAGVVAAFTATALTGGVDAKAITGTEFNNLVTKFNAVLAALEKATLLASS